MPTQTEIFWRLNIYSHATVSKVYILSDGDVLIQLKDHDKFQELLWSLMQKLSAE